MVVDGLQVVLVGSGVAGALLGKVASGVGHGEGVVYRNFRQVGHQLGGLLGGHLGQDRGTGGEPCLELRGHGAVVALAGSLADLVLSEVADGLQGPGELGHVVHALGDGLVVLGTFEFHQAEQGLGIRPAVHQADLPEFDLVDDLAFLLLDAPADAEALVDALFDLQDFHGVHDLGLDVCLVVVPDLGLLDRASGDGLVHGTQGARAQGHEPGQGLAHGVGLDDLAVRVHGLAGGHTLDHEGAVVALFHLGECGENLHTTPPSMTFRHAFPSHRTR